MKKNSFECVCDSTLTHFILICDNNCSNKNFICSINEYEEHCCIICVLNLLNCKIKKFCFSNEDYNVILKAFPSTVPLHNYLNDLRSDFIFNYCF